MEKKTLLLIVGILINSFLFGQNKTTVDFQLAFGMETGTSSPSITENIKISGDPTFGMQFNFQVIFNKVGFMLSYEKSSRIYQRTVINFAGNEVFFNEKVPTNRFMINFVGRIPVVANKVNLEPRFGLGKLLGTDRSESNANAIAAVILPISALFPKSLICWEFGLKSYYIFTPRVSCFIDASFTLTPYSYSVEKSLLFFNYTDFETSHISVFGLSAGISINIAKKKA